jgi:MFS family permease
MKLEQAGADPQPLYVVSLLCAAEVLSMTGFGTYPALLAHLRDTWSLSNAQAGFLGGVFFGGYMAAVPVLASLTDRIDARRIYLFANALATAGGLGLALLARGFWSAVPGQALVGAGLAGTYMPGLKALSDRVEGARQSRAVAFYTATFGIGSALSLFLAAKVFAAAGWRWAFGVAAAGPSLAGALVSFGLSARRPQARPGAKALLDWRPVIRNRAATGYILGYAGHCWELFGLRSWMVAFFAFSGGLHPAASLLRWGPAATASVINLLGPPVSILGNETAVRLGRRRTVLAIMVVSCALAVVTGFTAPLQWALVACAMAVYYIAIMSDSAALTAGLVSAAQPAERGATMALHSFLGFGAGFIAPLVFGVVLDRFGGNRSVAAWGLAFASLGGGGALGMLAMGILSARSTVPAADSAAGAA